MELLLGCGNSRLKQIDPTYSGSTKWVKLVTYDMDPNCGADIVADFEDVGLSMFPENYFDEIHAYEFLEHLRFQGDWKGFFKDFSEIYRVLKPGGYLCASTPLPDNLTTWSDPGHRRVFTLATFQFLDQSGYEAIGHTSMTDYRHVWKGDLRLTSIYRHEDLYSHYWTLMAIKPAGVLPEGMAMSARNVTPPSIRSTKPATA